MLRSRRGALTMPIKPENRNKYPPDWRAISLRVRTEAGWKCELCDAENGKPHPVTGSKVVLTVMHLDHDPANCSRSNLRAGCQRCHLTYDAQHHAANAKVTRQRKQTQARLECGQAELFAAVVSLPIPDYIYCGDKLTDPLLRGLPVNAVRDARGLCVRGKNGNMLLETVDGRRFVGLGRMLVKRKHVAKEVAHAD